MSIEVDTGLGSEIEEQSIAIRDAAAAVRVANALLLAQSMGEDITEPQAAQKVLRHLELVERWVSSDG